MATNHSLSCPTHNANLVQRVNPKGGGLFLGCPCFESDGCKVSYSLTTSQWFGLPSTVARASSNRSQCHSLRADVEAKLRARGEDPMEWLMSGIGIDEIARLLAA